MKKVKKNLVKKVDYNSPDYYLGLDYLIRKHPKNSHLRSCYEGVSFRNLARCIMFDRNEKNLELDEYLQRPQRFILYSASGEVMGVMVTVSLPEFYHEIEYEDYVAIDANSMSSYCELLNHPSFEGKVEIVTFSAKQAQLVKSKFQIQEVHCWSVFRYQGKKEANQLLPIRLMNEDDLQLAEHLSARFSDESSPLKALKFQLQGLDNKNYILFSSGDDPTLVGIHYYGQGLFRVNYFINLSNNKTLLYATLEAVGEITKASGYELILRFKETDNFYSKKMIKKSGFVKLVKEQHLHLTD